VTEPVGPAGTPAWDVVGVGANSVDLVHLLPAAPQPTGPHAKQRIHRQLVSCGGQMTTALACVAGFGWRTKYIGATGADERGAVLRAAMQDRRVDMSGALTRPDATNQFAVILVDETTGERIVLWDRDERLALHPDEVPAAAIAAARLVHVDDVDQAAAVAAARLGRQAGIPVTSDIDRLTDLTTELVAAVSIPMFAEHVPPALTGISDTEGALRALRRYHDGLLIVTLGTAGALALDGDRAIRSPGFSVRAIDTTGAGDVFRAGFIHGRLSGWPLERTLRFANAAAAVSCTRLGALSGVPSLADVEAMLARG
jgi:sugar/nucleoside kinase (ribokinase family)